MRNDVAVVILAAGLGTRMRSRQAKVLHRAGGDTLVGHAVNIALASAPPERIFVVDVYKRQPLSHSAGRTSTHLDSADRAIAETLSGNSGRD